MPKGSWEIDAAERLSWRFVGRYKKAYDIREDLKMEALLAVFEGKHTLPATKNRPEKERTDAALMMDTMHNYYRRFFEVGYKNDHWRESREALEDNKVQIIKNEDDDYPTAAIVPGKNVGPPED
jgi:hypothetical protein